MKRRYFVLIEILMDLSILYEIMRIYCIILQSLPSWERGLKFAKVYQLTQRVQVAPFVGAWIEISIDTDRRS